MKAKARVLIVDDEPNIRKILQASLERGGYAAESVGDANEALSKLSSSHFDVMFTDVLMPGMNGVELLQKAKPSNPDLHIVVMTAYGTIEQAVEAMRAGATDYITKPFDLNVVKRIVSQLTARPRAKKATPSPANDLPVAASPAMKEVMSLVERIAPSRATVLVTGESGTGKEIIAKQLHKLGSRSDGPFVAVNCAALPETLLESELFGYEKGAFTGADTAKAGRFENADGGTLFLDEIGEVPASVQVKLLRVLQERELERLGSSKPTAIDVRLVTATNRDLEAAVKRGEFREDLFFRLQVLHLHLPPLRERPEDIVPLALRFMAKFAAENGSSMRALDSATEQMLLQYRWPGNVRELENCVERAVVLAAPAESHLTTDLLPPQLRAAA